MYRVLSHSEESVYFLLEWLAISFMWVVTTPVKAGETICSLEQYPPKLFFPKTCEKETIKSLPVTSRVKCFITSICAENPFCRRGLLSICLIWFTANCNSNLFVWICGCEEHQMLYSEARWRESRCSVTPQQVKDEQDVDKLTNQEKSSTS